MADIENTLREVSEARSWDQKVEAIRRVPERHGQQEHRQVYAAIADSLYRPHLSPQFAFVQWREEYELEGFRDAYQSALTSTDGFKNITTQVLVTSLLQSPETLLVFRSIVGYTANELAYAIREVAEERGETKVTGGRLKAIEGGAHPSLPEAQAISETIHRLVSRKLWAKAPNGFQSKLAKPDTVRGWDSVREFAVQGAPYEIYLHQRVFGGAFRTLLDATSSGRGELLERAVESLLTEAGISHVRTGSANQKEIADRFNLTVQPAPDFVLFEPPNHLRAMIECKMTNDGGTARDKASRYAALRREAVRLGGVALFAVIDGLGWERVNDALGPVVRDCDGRVFTLTTLAQMLTIRPLSQLKSAS